MRSTWCETRYRGNLVDMHIPDGDERFLSRFDSVANVDALERANVSVAYFYASSCLEIFSLGRTQASRFFHFPIRTYPPSSVEQIPMNRAGPFSSKDSKRRASRQKPTPMAIMKIPAKMRISEDIQ